MHCPEEKNRFPGLQRARKTKIAKGAEVPLEGTLDLAEYFVGDMSSFLKHSRIHDNKHGPDGLSDITTTHPEFHVPNIVAEHSPLVLSSEVAHDAILSSLASESPFSITLLTLGPCEQRFRALWSAEQMIKFTQ